MKDGKDMTRLYEQNSFDHRLVEWKEALNVDLNDRSGPIDLLKASASIV